MPIAMRRDRLDDARRRRRDLAHDRRASAARLVRVAALRRDPALVRLERAPVGDRCLGPPAPLVHIDAEVGEREQVPRARVEDELGEVRRPVAAQRRERLADLERVPDRARRAADPCP